MQIISLIVVLLYTTMLQAQQAPIVIAENTIKISGLGDEVVYFGFAEGDQIIFNFEEQKGKEVKEIEIAEMPGSSRFMDYKSKKIENKTIQVHRTGIFKFRFSNNAIGGRICKYKIERIPASEAVAKFNPTVLWKKVYDTIERKVMEPVLIKKEYKAVSLAGPEEYYINGGLNAAFGGSSRVIVPVTLPKNTVEWYYTFSAIRSKEDIAKIKGSMKLLSNLTRIIDVSGGSAIALNLLAAPPGGDVCDVYLLDRQNTSLFEQKAQFRMYQDGSRENLKQGTIKVANKTLPQYFIGIKNPSTSYGISVTVEAVAILLEETWENREVIKYDITARPQPYLAQMP